MTALPEFVGDLLQLRPQPLLHRPSPKQEPPHSVPRTNMREPEEVERLRLPGQAAASSVVGNRKSPKLDEPCLVRV